MTSDAVTNDPLPDNPAPDNAVPDYPAPDNAVPTGGNRRPGAPHRAKVAIHDAIAAVTSQMSLAARVSTLTTVSVAVILSVLGTTAYVAANRQVIAALDTSMTKQAESLVATGATNSSTTSQTLSAIGIQYVVVGPSYWIATIQGIDAGLLKGVYTSAENDVANGVTTHSARTATIDGQRYRVVAVRGSLDNTVLVMWQPLDTYERALNRLSFALVSMILLGILFAGVAGWGVATNGLRPVRRLTAATERVAREGDLSPIENPNASEADDIVRLTSSFNSMLAALKQSQARERQLIADAGHELRTPLTSLRTNIELLRQSTMQPGRELNLHQKRELMDDVEAQLEELTGLVGDLVELARDEPVTHEQEPLELAEVVEAALERVRLRAPDLTFEVSADDSETLGDARSLERAVTNLLDNAAKWSPVGATVRVTLIDNEISIADQGPGIAPEDLPHVFDRFYRSAEARTLPGSGLGLSIVRRAAERHHGSVRVESVVGQGSTFILTLPPVPPAQA